MMKKLLLLSSLCLFGAAQGQQAALKIGGVAQASMKRNFPASNNPNSIVTGAIDTLHYFFNKHYYRNSQFVVPPQTGNENTLFYTIPTPYPGTLKVTHFGSVFNNSVNVTVTGLEGIIAYKSSSTSTAVPVTFILSTLNSSGMPVLPGLDSVTVMSTSNNSGDWIGANFTNPITVSSRFAVVVKIGKNAAAGDTISPYMNNASTPTSTAPVRQRYGEGLGRIRFGNPTPSWATTATGFGGGADYEFLLAPRVSFNYNAGVAVNNPTICTNSSGSFNNTTTPVGIVENRQFNFNAFYKDWSPWALTTNSLILNRNVDSIYTWAFTGASPATSFDKNPTVTFNSTGTQNAQLTAKYKPSASIGIHPSISDIATGSVLVTNAAAPILAISGPSAMCSGSNATLIASGSTTYTWTSPPVQSSSVVISPTATTVYTVSSSNNGCVGSQTTMVLVNTAPTVAVASPSAGCAGALFTLTASGASSYTWNNGTTTPSNVVSSPTAGVASFTVEGEKTGCAKVTQVIGVPINDKPEVSLFADANVLCTKATGGTSVALSGDPSGGSYSGQSVSFGRFTPNGAGTFVATYSYTDAATGCANKATTQMVVLVCDITGLNEGVLNNNIMAFPNPAVNGKVTVINLEGSNEIAVYNILGGVVSKEIANGSQYNVDLSSQSAGTYFMRITDAKGGVKTVKIISTK